MDRIRQKIKELRELLDDHNYYLDNSEQALGYSAALDDIEEFLDTLSEEPELVRHPPIAYTYPSDASRDEQLKMALLALLNSDLIKVAGNKFTKQDLIDWVEKQKEREELDKSLEEAAEEYLQQVTEETKCHHNALTYAEGYEDALLRIPDAFIAGAEWQKSQMLKDAYVESQIVEDGRIELGGDPLPCLNPIILLPYPQFNPGDKVRIVVLKAEEE